MIYNNNKKLNWLLFDGPADALWVENLNTVLDESKILCLDNGRRIKIPENFKFIFEVSEI